MSAIRTLLAGLIDYAGLFPPAGLDMRSAVQNYAEYVSGEDAWALGRFVLPAAQLPEFTEAFTEVCCEEREGAWLVNVLGSLDKTENAQFMESFVQGAAFLGAIELKADDAKQAEELLGALPEGPAAYVEFAPEKAGEVLPVLAKHGARAKLRTGGVTAEAIPDAATVAGFLRECAAAKVPFKATAGLHHPLRGVHPLTYEEGSPSARMHGFVNVFLAAAQAWTGKEEAVLLATLEEEDATVFQWSENAVNWRKNSVMTVRLKSARSKFAIGFGSCSFVEPISDLKALGWL